MRTPISTARFSKPQWLLMAIAAGLLLALIVVLQRVVAADYQSQINTLQQQIDANKRQAEALGARAATLQEAVNRFTAEIAAVEGQINLNEVKQAQLTQQIQANEQKLDGLQDVLRQIVAQALRQ